MTSDCRRPVLIAARRTAVMPRGGAFADLTIDQLACPVIEAVLADGGVKKKDLDQVIIGNALYGGGNPARFAALGAGIPDHVPAMTIDTQCCAGLDAILLAGRLIEAGAACYVLAGGVESFSRSPLRFVRPRALSEAPRAYDRPPFSPWADRDPEMIAAAADLAGDYGISEESQTAFAVASHKRARAAQAARRGQPELVPVLQDGETDRFARDLSARTVARSPLLPKGASRTLRAATIAPEADAAALVLVTSAAEAARRGVPALEFVDGLQTGHGPEQPALAGVAAGKLLLARQGISPGDLAVTELMEAFAVQAMVTAEALGLRQEKTNPAGGALARGHPIGASGAILAVRLFHEQLSRRPGAASLALIAAAGGLGTAAMFQELT